MIKMPLIVFILLCLFALVGAIVIIMMVLAGITYVISERNEVKKYGKKRNNKEH